MVGEVGTGGGNAGYAGGWPAWLFGGGRRTLAGGEVGRTGDWNACGGAGGD